MRRPWTAALLVSLSLAGPATAHKTFANHSAAQVPLDLFSLYDDRPDGCPPCFNCNLDDFQCHQFAKCVKGNGKCDCTPGFGGEDCSTPLCGALPDGNRNRAPRSGDTCDCKDGWGGINCNVCQTNQACNAMMPEGEGGVCFKQGQLVKENYQMCDITNRKILDQLKDKKPQATFSCNADTDECNFQCEHDPRLVVDTHTNRYSLGRPEGVLLLRPRYLQLQLRSSFRSKHIKVQLRQHQVRVRARQDAVWRRGIY